jgi:uncharacterized protein YebE (UPF0316 family)
LPTGRQCDILGHSVQAGYQFKRIAPVFATGVFYLKGGENKTLYQQLVILFCLNCISTGLSTLKTIFLSNRIIVPVYVTTFLDAVIFAYAFRLVATSSSIDYILVFALGRIAGVSLGNLIEKKLAVGLLEVTVYKHPKEGKIVADRLRDKGYSVTTGMGYGLQGKDRLVLNIIIPRKNLPELQESLEEYGQVNMAVKNVTGVSGKVGRLQIPDVGEGVSE